MQDFVIIGGGLVGLSAALCLQHSGRRVAIIEAVDYARSLAGGNNTRPLALSISSVQILRALGLWSSIEAQATPIRHIHISARGRWGVTRLQASDYELDAMGYVIESQLLGQCLLAAVMQSEFIELHDQAQFESITETQVATISYKKDQQKQQLRARLVLIADGAHSQARSAIGIGQQDIDYQQSVVVCNVEVNNPKMATAYERFTPQGPLAMLPLGGKRYACVWTLPPQRAETVCTQSNAKFIADLQQCFGYRLGLIDAVSERSVAAIHRTRADALSAGRCVVIGNAANALHPVAGQGFNLALRDVASLYECLLQQPLAALEHVDVAALTSRYAKGRESEHGRVIRYGDGLVSLFSNRLPVLDQMRAVGLGLLDVLPVLKAEAALAGMGLSFGGKRLLRGHL